MLSCELTVETDDAVRFVFTVENAGGESHALEFRDGCHADCAVVDGDEEVWRWSEGRMFTQALERATLEPGDARRYGFEWRPSRTGTFTARAELRARGDDCEAETTFSVE